MSPTRPTIFIGSSREALPYAVAVQNELGSFAFATRWDQAPEFAIGEMIFDALINATAKYDFAVFVFAADDVATVRGEQVPVPRDNVIFEYGLFVGKKRRQDVYIIAPEGHKDIFRALSDLAGVILGTYRTDNPNLQAAVSPACNKIKEKIASEAAKARDKNLIEEIATNVQKLLDAHTTNTRYLGEFPGFFGEHIVPMLRWANNEFHIACDFPTYGLFSAGAVHDEYVALLHEKKNSIAIHGLFLNENRRKKATFDQLAKSQAEFDTELKDPKFGAKIQAFCFRTGSPQFRTPDELGNKLIQMHATEIEDFKNEIARPNGTFAELDTPMPIYLWMADSKRAVFSIPHYGSQPTEHGFETENRDLVKSLKLLWERYKDTLTHPL